MFTEQLFIMILNANESFVYVWLTVNAKIILGKYKLAIPRADRSKHK